MPDFEHVTRSLDLHLAKTPTQRAYVLGKQDGEDRARKQILWLIGAVVASTATAVLMGFLAGLAVCALLAGWIVFRAYRSTRPEAAWEITSEGTRELWNDGPKVLARRSIKP